MKKEKRIYTNATATMVFCMFTMMIINFIWNNYGLEDYTTLTQIIVGFSWILGITLRAFHERYLEKKLRMS